MTDISRKKLSRDSLETLLMALMACKDEDGKYLPIYPNEALQDWLIDMYPEELRAMGTLLPDLMSK